MLFRSDEMKDLFYATCSEAHCVNGGSNKMHSPFMKFYYDQPVMLIENEDVEEGKANGVLGKFRKIILKRGVTINDLNKHTPRRGGNTRRNASNRSNPKKDKMKLLVRMLCKSELLPWRHCSPRSATIVKQFVWNCYSANDPGELQLTLKQIKKALREVMVDENTKF